jgi:hypothetical protein
MKELVDRCSLLGMLSLSFLTLSSCSWSSNLAPAAWFVRVHLTLPPTFYASLIVVAFSLFPPSATTTNRSSPSVQAATPTYPFP